MKEQEAMKEMNEVVRESVTKWCHERNLDSKEFLAKVRWDRINKCFCFMHDGIYYGVEEEDGNIHT